MRKNKMMRAASALTVLTMLSTCAISGTFAKYITQDSGSDAARVAKWGVALQVDGDLYATKYASGANSVAVTDITSTNFSVHGKQVQENSADTNVVAPGTENTTGFHFTVEGTPEVSSQVELSVTHQNIYLAEGTYAVMIELADVSEENYEEIMLRPVGTNGYNYENQLFIKDGDQYKLATEYNAQTTYYTCEDYIVVNKTYYPVNYTLTGSGVTYGAADYTGKNVYEVDTLEEIAYKLADTVDPASLTRQNALADTTDSTIEYTVTSKIFLPNTDLTDNTNGVNLDDCKLTWTWPINGQNDGADTILGNLMAEDIDNDDETKGDWKAKVVMLDTTDSDNKTWKSPVEHTDFCLDTQFGIDITVTQVD